jgi:hypothetical protein
MNITQQGDNTHQATQQAQQKTWTPGAKGKKGGNRPPRGTLMCEVHGMCSHESKDCRDLTAFKQNLANQKQAGKAAQVHHTGKHWHRQYNPSQAPSQTAYNPSYPGFYPSQYNQNTSQQVYQPTQSYQQNLVTIQCKTLQTTQAFSHNTNTTKLHISTR